MKKYLEVRKFKNIARNKNGEIPVFVFTANM